MRRAVSPGRVLCVALVAAVSAGCGSDGSARAAESAPLTLAADSASNPTVGLDPAGDRAYAAWVGVQGGANAVFLATLEMDGDRVNTPVRVNDIPGDAAPHLQAPAQVAIGPEGSIYVLWQNNSPVDGRRFPASDLRLAVSTDGGRSFRPAITVNDDAGGPPSSHTFHDLAVAADGTVYVSWIDSRERDAVAHQRLLPDGTHARHPGHGEGMTESPVARGHEHGTSAESPGPEIRVARSTDGGRTFEPSVVVDSGACPCCRTSLALGPDGSVYVAWRKIYPGDVRDVVVARADARALSFGEPVRVHRDEWVFPGCPHAGPSLAADTEGRVLVGWYTGREGRQGLWYAVSDDRARSFGPPSAVLTEDWVPPSQLRLDVEGDRVWAAWDDRTGERPAVRTASGLVGEPLRAAPGGEVSGSDPAIAAAGGGAFLAWLDGASARGAWLER